MKHNCLHVIFFFVNTLIYVLYIAENYHILVLHTSFTLNVKIIYKFILAIKKEAVEENEGLAQNMLQSSSLGSMVVFVIMHVFISPYNYNSILSYLNLCFR